MPSSSQVIRDLDKWESRLLRQLRFLYASVAIVASVLAFGCSTVKSEANLATLQVEARDLPAPRSDKRIEYILDKHPTQVTVLEVFRTTLTTAAITAYYLSAFDKHGWKVCDRRVAWDGEQVSYTLRKNEFNAEFETSTSPKTGEYSVSVSWDAFYVPQCNG